MSLKKIKKFNPQKFIDDLNGVRDVMVYVPSSGVFLRTTKKEVRKEAETNQIKYYITDKIFIRQRDVMIIT